jgi:hypothetical protein
MAARSLATALICVVCFTGSVGFADEVFTITADSTMDGTAGVLMTIEDPPGALAATHFMITQAGKIRVHATRDAGSPTWTVHATPVYLVTKNRIDPGDTWRYLDEDDGSETIAEAIVEESVETPAGTFMAWRVDVARASNPTKLVRSVWFADDLGIVREVEYFDQWIQWEGLLEVYSVTGNGHFPLSVGNTWSLLSGGVPTRVNSLSAVKGQYLGQ